MLARLNSLPQVTGQSVIAQVSGLTLVPDRSQDFGNELHHGLIIMFN